MSSSCAYRGIQYRRRRPSPLCWRSHNTGWRAPERRVDAYVPVLKDCDECTVVTLTRRIVGFLARMLMCPERPSPLYDLTGWAAIPKPGFSILKLLHLSACADQGLDPRHRRIQGLADFIEPLLLLSSATNESSGAPG